MCDLLPPGITGMRGEGVVESLAIDILRVFGKMVANRQRKIDIGAVGHVRMLGLQRRWRLMPVNPREWNGS